MHDKLLSGRTAFMLAVLTPALFACGTLSEWWGGPAAEQPSTATRPQLASADASKYTIQNYLAQAGTLGAEVKDNWNPTAGVKLEGAKPDFVVDKAGKIKTVQEAVVAAVKAVQEGKKSAETRQYILVKPGTYDESLFIPAGVTLTLYSDSSDASKTVITQKTWAGSTQAEYQALANPGGKIYVEGQTPQGIYDIYWMCAKRPKTMGTSCSAGTVIRASGFEAKNLTWRNDFDESSVKTNNVQAVALVVDGADKVVFDNVRFSGNQDTLYAKSSAVETVNRVYFKDCYVEGDVDFIFGRSTMVFDHCTINFLGARVAGGSKDSGYLIAPSTSPKRPYGFLIIDSKLTADSATKPGSVALGRSWDEGRNNKDRPYEHGVSPNGQAVIRDSWIGGHIKAATPWASAASTNRPYSAEQNRFEEYRNYGPGAKPTK